MANPYYEFAHAPGANLDYSFDWSLWLEPGDYIITSTWTSPNLTLTFPSLSNGMISATFAGGGVVNNIYPLTNSIVTSQGKIDSRTMYLSCKTR